MRSPLRYERDVMVGNWVSECTLCKWAERHVEQDDALKAATMHSIKSHPEEHASLTSGKWITHVQNRAADALGHEVPKPPEAVQPSQSLTSDDPLVLPAATSEPNPEGA